MAEMEPQGNSNSSLSSGLSSQLHLLPPEALARVLGAVPQQQRLASCALLCRAWRDAALAATTQLELEFFSHPQKSPQLSAWLARHGSGLHSLSVSRSYVAISLELPWPSLRQLRRLNLDWVHFSCSITSSTAGTASQAGPGSVQQLAQLTALTSLVLKGCRISSGVLDLYQQQLPALRQLRELVLQGWEAWTADGLGAALATALRQLTALTRLHAVVAPDGAAAVISSLSSLQQLQDLRLLGDTSMSWSDVPASVTALELSGFDVLQLQAASGAGCPLTALQRLTIKFKDGCSLTGVAALSGLPQLQQLRIDAVFGADAMAGTRALLAALAQQRQLQSLTLNGDIELPAGQTQHYAALASSSQLTALSITVADALPAPAVLSAMFGAGRRLPLLQRFEVRTEFEDDSGDFLVPWALAPQDVSRLLQACPGLRELEFVPAAAAGATWAKVAGAATQLTKVVVGIEVDAAFASQLLARLTGLQDLALGPEWATDVALEALVPLTRLTGLTRLTPPENAWVDERAAAVPCAPDCTLATPCQLGSHDHDLFVLQRLMHSSR